MQIKKTVFMSIWKLWWIDNEKQVRTMFQIENTQQLHELKT